MPDRVGMKIEHAHRAPALASSSFFVHSLVNEDRIRRPMERSQIAFACPGACSQTDPLLNSSFGSNKALSTDSPPTGRCLFGLGAHEGASAAAATRRDAGASVSESHAVAARAISLRLGIARCDAERFRHRPRFRFDLGRAAASDDVLDCVRERLGSLLLKMQDGPLFRGPNPINKL